MVFTLPHDLNPVAQGNPGLIYRLLFKAASQTLLEFGRNPRWLGGELRTTDRAPQDQAGAVEVDGDEAIRSGASCRLPVGKRHELLRLHTIVGSQRWFIEMPARKA